MRGWAKYFLTVSLALLLAACAMLGERSVRVSSQQLQQKLNARLTQTFTVLKVFQVQLSNALVALDPVTGRIHTTMDAQLSSGLLSQVSSGKLGISGLLQFDAARQAVMLDQPEVDFMQLEGTSLEVAGMVDKYARQAASRWLKEVVLYQVKPEELVYGGTRYQPSQIQVTSAGIQITLKPQ